MAAYTNESRLNSAIAKARNIGVEVNINNFEIEVYWTTSSVGYLYVRSDREHMDELLRDLTEAVEAKASGY